MANQHRLDAEVKIVVFALTGMSHARDVLGREDAEHEVARLLQEGWEITTATSAGEVSVRGEEKAPAVCLLLQRG